MINGLGEHGFQVRQIAQEHSFVKDMWLRVTGPDLLIFLDVTYQESIRRRPQNYSQEEHQEQRYRLRHARDHADYYLHTDDLSIKEVKKKVLIFLSKS